MEWIDYRQIPVAAGGFSELFFDYLYDFEEVKNFYVHDFRESRSFEDAIALLSSRMLDRATVAAVMAEQNRVFGSSPKTFENISLLERPGTFAVVTGQQVGLFGGPMYTVFKTITTIKLAERLKAKFPGNDFVPVFWIEGEDHDFAEMNHVGVLGGEGQYLRIEYLPGGHLPERNPGPVGELVFDAALDQTFTALRDGLQHTEFTDPLLNQLRDAYAREKTFNRSFAAWMNFLFEGYGLVFISPNDRRLKKLLSPLFTREILEFPKTSQLIIAQSAELERNYHAQVKPRSVNLFLFHRGGRYAIEPREHDFSLRGTRHFLQKDELLKIADETPELLSPNVVLRPIAQDTLLPTAVYVAGPSEISYQAQLKPLYAELGLPQPVIYPRASASFVEERLMRVMEKYQLDLAAFLEDPSQIKERVLEQIEDVKLDRLFGDTTHVVHDALGELRFALKEIDATLQGPLDGVKSKFDVNLGVLREKAVAAQERRHDTAMRQIEKSAASLLPNNALQERELSILYYMNKYGIELTRWLMGELDITGFKHQLLSL